MGGFPDPFPPPPFSPVFLGAIPYRPLPQPPHPEPLPAPLILPLYVPYPPQDNPGLGLGMTVRVVTGVQNCSRQTKEP